MDLCMGSGYGMDVGSMVGSKESSTRRRDTMRIRIVKKAS